MGAACCKRLEPASPTASPHLPCCEVVRRCLRLLCAVDPPQQKTVIRTRKYGLSDIVGPVVKKDSWAQTDPLPPPRRRKRKGKQRKRSRSVEFLPYLLDRRSSRTSGSLEDIPGQEDALDFQTYFMSRLPRNSVGDGKEDLSGRKKEFLSALLGEENNNLMTKGFEEGVDAEPMRSDASGPGRVEEDKKQQELGVAEMGEAGSRRSSITESLREFESSLLEMLEEDECSLSKEVLSLSKEPTIGAVTDDGFLLRRGSLTPLQEEKDEDLHISPIQDESDQERRMNETTLTKLNGLNQSNTVIDNSVPASIINTSSLAEMKNEKIMNGSFKSNIDLSDKQLKDQPPTITVEIVS